jgi:hypothetical protein
MTTSPDDTAEPNDSNYTDVRIPDEALPDELHPDNELEPKVSAAPSVNGDVAGTDPQADPS